MRAWDVWECGWNREDFWWKMRLQEEIGAHSKVFYCFSYSQREALKWFVG